jgi:hypothetical protein
MCTVSRQWMCTVSRKMKHSMNRVRIHQQNISALLAKTHTDWSESTEMQYMTQNTPKQREKHLDTHTSLNNKCE